MQAVLYYLKAESTRVDKTDYITLGKNIDILLKDRSSITDPVILLEMKIYSIIIIYLYRVLIGHILLQTYLVYVIIYGKYIVMLTFCIHSELRLKA